MATCRHGVWRGGHPHMIGAPTSAPSIAWNSSKNGTAAATVVAAASVQRVTVIHGRIDDGRASSRCSYMSRG